MAAPFGLWDLRGQSPRTHGCHANGNVLLLWMATFLMSGGRSPSVSLNNMIYNQYNTFQHLRNLIMMESASLSRPWMIEWSYCYGQNGKLTMMNERNGAWPVVRIPTRIAACKSPVFTGKPDPFGRYENPAANPSASAAGPC
jgi:hypothetical protein